ncbi:hypothetical protein SSAG_05830 [Streptomyces sp. Mg1]|nr:hypothetical protein SSAG_05830 [Streptomyces sp. Mg1]
MAVPEQRPGALLRRRHRGQRYGRPLDLEQRLRATAARRADLLRRDRAQYERLDRGDRCARRVGELQRDRVAAGRGQPDPYGAGAGRVQPDTAPGEREPSLAGLLDERAETGRVEGGVQERRVEAEPVGRLRGLLVQADLRGLGVFFFLGRAQALEGFFFLFYFFFF